MLIPTSSLLTFRLFPLFRFILCFARFQKVIRFFIASFWCFTFPFFTVSEDFRRVLLSSFGFFGCLNWHFMKLRFHVFFLITFESSYLRLFSNQSCCQPFKHSKLISDFFYAWIMELSISRYFTFIVFWDFISF